LKSLVLTACGLLIWALGIPAAAAGEYGSGVKSDLPPRLGVEAGIDLSNLYGDVANDMFGSRLGVAGGVFLNLPLDPILAFQPEILYEQKGGKFNGSFYQLDYVEVPLLLNITFGSPDFNPGILLGPAIGDIVASRGVPKTIDHFDLGLVIGAQVDFSKFFVSGRYEMGVMDLSSDQQVKNSTVTFLVGLSYI